MKINKTTSLPFLLHLVILFSCRLMQASSSRNESDMVALLKFKDGITSDPHGIFNSWNDSLPFCQWFGITCSGRHDGRVTSMVLKGKNLVGTISPFIGNLSFLRDLNLQNNSFRGQIPQEIGYLSRLLQLSVNNNTLDGEIPENLTRCSQLRILDLSWNNLTGKIPADVGSLSMLEIIQISTNNLIGKIPPSI
ncbi:LRR receptor-like serine/threonine-protein kinase EFR [Mercurialis annua]|uniref:LRR receptor-like serine/threonine-protein kinase EFR n=1 Tax=Mercurialis annua TaxID=3986 RepID=UPI00215EA70A|nr:LRR receptor-like serine/threonine-protein kinase EFR [Mercurialis annua]